MKRSVVIMMLLALGSAWAVSGAAQANHCGTGGSPHDVHGSCETANNEIRCADGEADAADVQVYASPDGVGVCNDGDDLPLKGRVGANEDCMCVYADGSSGNPDPADGWIRIDQDGPSCSVSGQQSYNSGPGGGPESCG